MLPVAPTKVPTAVGGLKLLDVAASDTLGRDLRLSVCIGDHPAVSTIQVQVTTHVTVCLSVLAASHRIIVRGCDDEVLLAETVACTTGDLPTVTAGRLPLEHHWTTPSGTRGWFRSEAFDGAESFGLARRRVDGAEQNPLPSLAVRFPGHPDAITSLALTGGGDHEHISWITRHLYPGVHPHGVTTATTVALSDSSPIAPRLP